MTKPLNVLSFDIGIKNMAFCLLSVDQSAIKMLDWCVIDISKNDEIKVLEVQFCDHTKNTKKCKTKAKYEKNGKFYCGKHAKAMIEYIVPEKRLTTSYLKKKIN
jgi:hypothetical protein